MFFVVRSNDSFNFPLGWIKYIVIVVIDISIVCFCFERHGSVLLILIAHWHVDTYCLLLIPGSGFGFVLFQTLGTVYIFFRSYSLYKFIQTRIPVRQVYKSISLFDFVVLSIIRLLFCYVAFSGFCFLLIGCCITRDRLPASRTLPIVAMNISYSVYLR